MQASARSVSAAREATPRAEDVLECDCVVGRDGFWGVSRRAVPAETARVFERTYPYAWLGVLADVPPSHDELIHARHDRPMRTTVGILGRP